MWLVSVIEMCTNINDIMPPALENRDISNYNEISNRKETTMLVKNPHIAELQEDVLYHLSLSTGTHDLQEMFGDVKFVCSGGTTKRMADFAHFVAKELNIKLPPGTALYDISGSSYRFSMYKVGPVLCVSHGMGTPSMSIMLHEVIKLLHYSECKDVTFLRLGTCGGIGLEGGTLVITKSVVDGLFRPYQEVTVLGRRTRRPSIVDQTLATELHSLAQQEFPNCPSVCGTTMCTDDFYEGQARLDGAFCSFTHEEKMEFLQTLREKGIVNMEMESLAFSAMCSEAGISAAVICVALLNRLEGDQVATPKEVMEEWQHRPMKLAALFIKKRLGLL